MTTQRYCIIDAKGGPLTVKFTVSPSIMAGAEFRLINPKNKLSIADWKISADNGNSESFTIRMAPEEMHQHILNWGVLCCSPKVEVFEGKIIIEFFQAGKKSNLTVPTEYFRNTIPPCKLKVPDSFEDSLIFISRKSE